MLNCINKILDFLEYLKDGYVTHKLRIIEHTRCETYLTNTLIRDISIDLYCLIDIDELVRWDIPD